MKYYINAIGEQHYAHGSGGTEYGGIARVGEAGGGGGGGADEEERALGSRLVMQWSCSGIVRAGDVVVP